MEEEHKWTLGYLGMTTQLAFENKLNFKAGLKRVTNCTRNHGIRANIRKKKHNRVKRHEKYINDNLLDGQFDRQRPNEVWVTDTTEVLYGVDKLKKARVHIVLDLYGRYALSYNISVTETAISTIEAFRRAFKMEPDAHPMIHTDREAAYCSIVFNDYLASRNCIHSMSQLEHWWNDFTLIWSAKRARPKTLEELEESVKESIEYFNTQRAYTSKNGLTAEKFRVQTA